MLAKLHQRLWQHDDAEGRRHPGNVAGKQDIPHVKQLHDASVSVHRNLHVADRES